MENYWFVELEKIIDRIITLCEATDIDIIYSKYTKVEDLLEDLYDYKTSLANCSFEFIDDIVIDFAPTSTFQELAIDNGWQDEYINLSNQADCYINLLVTHRERIDK